MDPPIHMRSRVISDLLKYFQGRVIIYQDIGRKVQQLKKDHQSFKEIKTTEEISNLKKISKNFKKNFKAEEKLKEFLELNQRITEKYRNKKWGDMGEYEQKRLLIVTQTVIV